MSIEETLSNLVIFSVRSTNEEKKEIVAMRDGYVKRLQQEGIGDSNVAAPGEALFALNILELERDAKVIESQMALLKLTESRLSEDYINSFVIKPLNDCYERAILYHAACQKLYELLVRKRNSETVPISDLLEISAQQNEAGAFVNSSKLAVIEKSASVAGQRRRLSAEKNDLYRRQRLVERLISIQTFKSTAHSRVTWHTFDGGFVEAGDLICDLSAP
jgi:hypothetical protein